VETSHDLARTLYPVSLQLSGLPTALAELARQVEEMFPICCRFRNGNTGRLADANLERQLYRIAQEAASNAAKHSKGKHITITLRESKHWLTLTIKDDGIGISEAGLAAHDLGLNIMEYRADLIGATLAIVPQRGHGTTVICKLRKPSP
jgi:signal transduction histidine kinase